MNLCVVDAVRNTRSEDGRKTKRLHLWRDGLWDWAEVYTGPRRIGCVGRTGLGLHESSNGGSLGVGSDCYMMLVATGGFSPSYAVLLSVAVFHCNPQHLSRNERKI